MQSRTKSKKRLFVPIAGLALIAGMVAMPLGLQSCTATKNSDGSWSIEFAPDMIVNANGLEEAIMKLIELLKACQTGGFERDCTESEIHDIHETIVKMTAKKNSSIHGAPPAPPAPPQTHPPAPQPG